MKKILFVLLTVSAISCSKTNDLTDSTQEKIMVRIESVDTDGNKDYTETIVVNIKK